MSQAPSEMTVHTAVKHGAQQCLQFGVTTVGDISRQCDLTRPVLKNTKLRAVSFGEVQAMAQRRQFLEARLEKAADASLGGDRLQIGISPHAPYSIEPQGFQRCLQVAQERGLPLCTHLAENDYEGDFLADHDGPFRELWRWIDGWDDRVPRFDGGPIRFAQSLGLLAYPTLLAHVNYCDDEELDVLSRGNASVAYCPRTHQYFGHPPHRWRDFLSRGINVVIGTDSCASSGDLNLLDDLRLVQELSPDTPSIYLFEMVTTRAARALGKKNVGCLKSGAAADIVAFPTATDDPLTEILESRSFPQSVWIDGIASNVA